jgi:outer membrane protein TolC
VKPIYILAPLMLALSIACLGQTEPRSVPVADPAAIRLSVDEAVAAALGSYPKIRAVVRRLSLAQMKINTARGLDDPMLMVRDWGTPLKQPWDMNQAQTMFMLQQSFQSKQKRDQRASLAEDDAGIAAIELQTLRQEVAAQTRQLCDGLLRNADEMRLLERQRILLKDALAVALAQYSIGKAPQSDVLRAQMALTRLKEHLIELEEERDNTRAQLNTLMSRPSGEAIEVTGSYAIPETLPAIEELERTAIEHRPELAVLRTEVAKSRDEGTLTRLAMRPDFTVGLGYMLMPTGSSSRNAYMVELSMNLPWLNRERHDGEAKQADAATNVSQAELDERTSSVFLEIRQAQIVVLAAEKRVKLYRDTLLPEAEASFNASTAAYQNNRAVFMSLIDAQNILLDIQTAYYEAMAATDVGMAQLERAIGTPISNATNRNTKR